NRYYSILVSSFYLPFFFINDTSTTQIYTLSLHDALPISEQKIVPSDSAAVVRLSLFSTISKPPDVCLPAEIRVTASYLDASSNLIFSGTVENLAIQNTLTGTINLHSRPWDLREFSRWRNEPPQTNSGAKRLVCVNAEGLAEVTSEEMARATSVRVRETAL